MASSFTSTKEDASPLKVHAIGGNVARIGKRTLLFRDVAPCSDYILGVKPISVYRAMVRIMLTRESRSSGSNTCPVTETTDMTEGFGGKSTGKSLIGRQKQTGK
jgi:hypothetical protein